MNTTVTSIAITDVDTDFSYHQFFIIEGNSRQEFSMTHAGELKVEKLLDREKFDRYTLKIAVTDGVFTRYKSLTVIVKDVNGKTLRILIWDIVLRNASVPSKCLKLLILMWYLEYSH